MKGKPKLDYQRLKQINEALAIPLVIHGGTGLSSDQFRNLIDNGVAKINYFTGLADAASVCIQENAETIRSRGYTRLMQNVQHAVSIEAERCMRLWAADGRATEVLSCCRSWMPVEHLIIYNVTGIDEEDVDKMLAEGRRVLGAILGVREVVTAKAVKEDAKYRYTWLVRFCHPAVIESYREHPDHVAFADNRFRPVADERISIDYQTVEPVVLRSDDVERPISNRALP